MKKPELLAPAGNPEKLKTALIYGADAGYLGGKNFGLRALGGNFTEDEIREGAAFAHSLGRKVYVTLNIIAHNQDLAGLPSFLSVLQQAGIDAVLVADLGVFRTVRTYAPDLPIHISTQANSTNWAAAEAWREMGARRIVLARELSLRELREIREKTPAELEVFVHGAMCIAYSGRCLLSHYLTGRDANRGACAQACRWNYRLTEETRPGQYFPIEEDARGAYIMNSKDLCLLPHLGDLLRSGIDSLKIEGRMKSVHYVASVVKAYRLAIDAYIAEPEKFEIQQEWLEELDKVSHRAYTAGFFRDRPGADAQIYGTTSYEQTAEFKGLVLRYEADGGIAVVEQRGHMRIGQELEVLAPRGNGFRQILSRMYDAEGLPIEAAPHPRQIVRIPMQMPVEPYAILRRALSK